MDNPGEILRLCRLCLVKDQVNIPIFEEQGDIRQTFLKIRSCLPVKVSRDDKLPKKICGGCSNKLDLFYEFWSSTANSEKTLQSWLGQEEEDDKMQEITKPVEALVKEESEALEDGHAHDQSFDEATKDEAEAPPAKRARRTAAVKAQINISHDSDEDEDVDGAEPITKIEDESDDSDGEEKDPSYTEVPGTSADDQAGPSGLGKDGVEAPPQKPHTCNVCRKHFPTAKLHSNHMDNLQAFVYVYCNSCGSSDSIRNSEKHHDTLFFCAVCKHFLSASYWTHKCLHRKHIQQLAEAERSSCQMCLKELFNDLDASRHSCADDNEVYCKCCKITFSDLKLHCRNFELNNFPTNYCASCQISFSCAANYQKHLLEKHLSSHFLSSKQEFNCKFCSLKFPNKNLLTAHERKLHSNETTDCPLCKKQLKLAKMKGHLTTHRSQKFYQNAPVKICSICGAAVKNFRRHMTTHASERKYKCQLCNKDFKLAWDMKKHLVSHQGEAKHKCSVCGKGFKLAYNLKVHQRIHDSIKPFDCLVCNKSFTTKQSRNLHLKIHDRVSFGS
ncbi:zinc finger protein 596-like isoform X32 [Euwallacea similis]|uniref:zinc finger protein 596-like isoform X32 n=1 Tax=Euwallacea similis TaxID=1736056 RepID=UPI00344C2A2C